MADPEPLEVKCKVCNLPLFLDKEECKEFVEGKMKQGYIVCSCCGSKQEIKK